MEFLYELQVKKSQPRHRTDMNPSSNTKTSLIFRFVNIYRFNLDVISQTGLHRVLETKSSFRRPKRNVLKVSINNTKPSFTLALGYFCSSLNLT